MESHGHCQALWPHVVVEVSPLLWGAALGVGPAQPYSAGRRAAAAFGCGRLTPKPVSLPLHFLSLVCEKAEDLSPGLQVFGVRVQTSMSECLPGACPSPLQQTLLLSHHMTVLFLY